MNRRLINWPGWTRTPRNLFFRLYTLNRGYRVTLGESIFRLDESLRRFSVAPEDFLYRALSSTLRPGDTFFDVGANLGLYSLIAARLVGQQGKVYGFEPSPANFRILERNIHLNRLDSIIGGRMVAMTSSTDCRTVDFFVPSAGNTSGEASLRGDTGNSTIVKATAETIDRFCSLHDLAPNVIKIDTEGAELPILRGAENVIRTFKPILIVEYHGGKCADFGYTTEELWGHIQSLGYDQKYLMGEGRGYSMTLCRPASQPCTPGG